MAPPDQPPLSGDLQLLIEHAKELAEARHPDANAAWDRAAAAGTDLPPDAAAHLARSRAGRLLPGDPAEAYAALCEAAGQFAALGDRERELEARAYAAQAARLSGKSDEAEADVSLGWELLEITLAEAADAFGRGEMTTRYYLNVLDPVRVGRQRPAHGGGDDALGARPAGVPDGRRAPKPELVAERKNTAAQLGRMLGNLS